MAINYRPLHCLKAARSSPLINRSFIGELMRDHLRVRLLDSPRVFLQPFGVNIHRASGGPNEKGRAEVSATEPILIGSFVGHGVGRSVAYLAPYDRHANMRQPEPEPEPD